MTIIFDKNLSTERSISIDFFTEQILDQRLHANWEKIVSDSSEIPEVKNFVNNRTFETIEIQDHGISIPIQGTYNRVAQVSTTYIAENQSYSLSIVLDYVAAE